MRRAVLSHLAVFSFASLVFAVAACATSSTVEDGDLTAGQNQPSTIPDDAGGAKLPPSSSSAPSSTTDAGPKDASSPPADASSTPKDSGSSGSTTTACDPEDPIVLIKLFTAQNPPPCPCNTGQCCFEDQFCL
jgi:hypothetical protein